MDHDNIKKYFNDKNELHRLDGPAVESDHFNIWYKNGKRHRGDDLPAVEYPNGDKEYWVSGKKSRSSGLPAVEYINGDKEYWVNGKLHREDGPAIEYDTGEKFWFLNGINYPQKNYEKIILDIKINRFKSL